MNWTFLFGFINGLALAGWVVLAFLQLPIALETIVLFVQQLGNSHIACWVTLSAQFGRQGPHQRPDGVRRHGAADPYTARDRRALVVPRAGGPDLRRERRWDTAGRPRRRDRRHGRKTGRRPGLEE